MSAANGGGGDGETLSKEKTTDLSDLSEMSHIDVPPLSRCVPDC